ncbi:nuclease SbcCD subunit D [Bacillus sp. J14TS2]|uniref:exonuclease SbcCD subunit D n=1 Tax=Bacillus sp. J14TS2 TaxID=2807188 RepID=UPI001B230F74|nr:exonuclease SbcCD subunit D [Bacillus sp. J14TS2]GIN73709.1 nuclease SbcCD subunit D [Bacillus sp. J14TS2]
MKIFHTADWHLGKLVQGVYMTEDQRFVLQQFIEDIKQEQPDVVIVAGDLYDRAVPPTEAVQLLDEVLEAIVLQLETPVLAIAGNHDSPSRLHFGSKIMEQNGLHMSGRLTKELHPVMLQDAFGPVHFHLVPYCDPSMVRNVFEDEEIRTHQDAARKIITEIKAGLDPRARHVLIGHAFVTPFGEEQENTSDSERPLSIGGAEHVDAQLFSDFHYTALGHLHQAHYVMEEKIRYAGSILKYSVSEEHHRKGYSIVELDQDGDVTITKKAFTPKRDLRTVEATLSELLAHPICDDYVFVRLLDETPILSPMEKIRSVYPNAMHVERKLLVTQAVSATKQSRSKMSDVELFQSFYEQVKGEKATEETERIFKEIMDELLQDENETSAQTEREFVSN